MRFWNRPWQAACASVLLLWLAACGGGGSESPPADTPAAVVASPVPCGDAPDPSTTRPTGWTTASHDKSAAPDPGLIFPGASVLRMDITIPPCKWQALLADMALQAGRSAPATRRVLPTAPAVGCTGGGTASDGEFLRGTPLWIPVNVAFNGQDWTRVGLRLKGSSSLVRSWDMGLIKLPFRLDFDKFENDFPAVRGQRMFGYEKLSFTNNVVDPSFMREKITSDLLRESGIPAARAAWVRVYVDFGSGSQYFGLYTMNEVPGKTLLNDQFGNKDGNLYKPQGDGANWAPRSLISTATFQSTFEKESNAGAADWSDVAAALDALNAPERSSNAALWRARLEQRFNVNRFLQWMSANAVLGNGDAYGFIAHNYYLYADANDTGRLNWIPWDHDRALTCANLDISYPASGYSANRTPLFRYLLDDASYRAAYSQHAANFLAGAPFDAANLGNRLDAALALITPYVTGAQGEAIGTRTSALESMAHFDTAQTNLRTIVGQRRSNAAAMLPLP